MSEKKKYIIEVADNVQMISLIGVNGDGAAFTITGDVCTYKTADKELKEAYQKGFEAGSHEATTLEYQRGLDDAWKTAKYLFSEMSNTEINLVFPHEWNNGGFKALMALDPKDAIDRINAFERKQKAEEIKVGDEVRKTSGFMDNAVGYFFGDSSDGCYKVLRYVDGKFKTGIWNKENCKRTGKHSDAVVQLLEAIKGGAE